MYFMNFTFQIQAGQEFIYRPIHFINYDPQQAAQKAQKVGLVYRKCKITSSPEWRKGSDGEPNLCNRCGLKYARKIRSENEVLRQMSWNRLLNPTS